MFEDRSEAGKVLAKLLAPYRNSDAVIVALPRGGVVIGYEISKALGFPLDILPIRKIGHPTNLEVAIGAVNEDGSRILSEYSIGVSPVWIKESAEIEMKESQRRARNYRVSNPITISGKTVILVDDGIATGLTMRLAVSSIKAKKPKEVVVAIPVAAEEAVKMLESMEVKVIVLEPPNDFLGAVGAHYTSFYQITDEEVVRLMKALG